MDFFNKLSKKASETYQNTKEKTVKFSEEMKLKGKINESKNKIEELYQEIGKYVYEQYNTNTDEGKDDIKAKCEEIKSNFDEISKLETSILELKEVKKCFSCGTQLKKDDEFCSKCGKEQPKREEKVEVKVEFDDEVKEEIKDADVTEIKDAEKVEEEMKNEE